MMHRFVRTALLTSAFMSVWALPARAQATAGVVADLMADVGQVEDKLVALARALPAEKYAWRPGAGVRSFGEVFLHVAADNYMLPAALGAAIDPATGIKAGDFATATAFETRKLSKDQTIAELQKSFIHLKTTMAATKQERLAEKISLFGQTFTVQRTWILTTTHLHEHLGQSIAYARSNNIVPPWSK